MPNHTFAAASIGNLRTSLEACCLALEALLTLPPITREQEALQGSAQGVLDQARAALSRTPQE